MLASNIYKNLCRARLRHFGGSRAHLRSFLVGTDSVRRERESARICGKPIFPQLRRYSGGLGARLPPTSDFPVVLWPAIFKTIRNAFFINMVVRPQYDPEFDIAEFISASKQALFVVSNALAREDYEFLNGLVTEDAIKSLTQKMNTFTSQQKELIAVHDKEDVYMTFPYEVGIIQEGEQDRQRTFVEITVVHHILRGLSQMKEAGESPPLNMGILPEYQERLFAANYRFIREYTKGVDSSWIINVVNHFMPVAVP